MSRRIVHRALFTLGLLMALAAPATAQAWIVTVHVHGAGLVDEITPRNLMFCTVGPSGKGNGSVTDCVAGTQTGHYSHGDIVELQALVPQAHYDRGWRFSHWADSSAGGGKINCDPQGGAGQPPIQNCRFQIFENLEVDLYFTDGIPPDDTVIGAGGPTQNQATNSTSAAFTFDSPSESTDARYDCRLDPPGADTGSFAECGGPFDKGQSYSGLADGTYTFYVRAKDPSGNVDPTPATRTWTVDTVAPSATIGGSPAQDALTNDRTPELTATASDGTLVCRMDGAVAPCTFTASLADGLHTFTATATDAAGNFQTASRSFTVDGTAPVITFTSGPANGSTTNQPSPAFAWSANEGGSAFTCSLDDAAFGPCAALPALPDGTHTFRVRMTDHAGNQGNAERTWTIDTAVPDTTLLGGPAEGASSPSPEATFEFASPESGATFECRLDGAAFTACASPLKLTGLTNDDHVFEVRARDAAGNVDATPVRRAWRVNSLDGDSDGYNRPADCDDSNAAIHPGATEIPGDAIDQNCAAENEPVVVADNDRDDDGVSAGLDCDDSNPAIRPGAVDVPADGIDQDCKDGDAAFPVASAALNYNFKPAGGRTRILRMVLSKIEVGATVKVTCKGRGCPVRSRSVRPSKGTVDVRKLLKRKPLRAGSTLTLRITQPGHVAKVISFKMRRGKSPAGGVFRCIQPGSTKLTACP